MKCSLFATIFLLLCVSGDTDIEFEGFTLEAAYTYYTNGVNVYTQLTCNATSNIYTDINTTWIEVTGNSYTDTGSSMLRFEDIATEVKWGDQRDYLCRAVYQTDPVMYQDSHSITVRIKCELIVLYLSNDCRPVSVRFECNTLRFECNPRCTNSRFSTVPELSVAT